MTRTWMFTAINSEYHKLWYVQTMRYLVNNEKEKKKYWMCLENIMCWAKEKKKPDTKE